MRMDRYMPADHPLSRIYRVGSAIFGAGLVVFGALGLSNSVPLFATRGIDVLGLSSNGLLALISVVVGVVLVGAAAWGGIVASTTTATIGGLFFLSGLVNLGLINTPWNVLAFRFENVVFSFVAGLLLLFLGTYGRLSGGLPENNPFVRYRHREPPTEVPEQRATEERRVEELTPIARAEIAFGEGRPTAEQDRLVRARARQHQFAERQRAYDHHASRGRSPEQQISSQNPWADYSEPEHPSAPPQ